MIAEFVRLRPAPTDFSHEVATKTVFICEWPDADNEESEAWQDCGRVTVSTDVPFITAIDIDLAGPFMLEQGSGPSECLDLLRVVLLWIGWEAGWSPDSEVAVRISLENGSAFYRYLALSDTLIPTI